jgi:hypothetical protein
MSVFNPNVKVPTGWYDTRLSMCCARGDLVDLDEAGWHGCKTISLCASEYIPLGTNGKATFFCFAVFHFHKSALGKACASVFAGWVGFMGGKREDAIDIKKKCSAKPAAGTYLSLLVVTSLVWRETCDAKDTQRTEGWHINTGMKSHI